MEQELRHRGLRSRDLNLIKLSGGGGRQRKEDHGDKRGRDRKRGKRKNITADSRWLCPFRLKWAETKYFF